MIKFGIKCCLIKINDNKCVGSSGCYLKFGSFQGKLPGPEYYEDGGAEQPPPGSERPDLRRLTQRGQQREDVAQDEAEENEDQAKGEQHRPWQ